MATYSAPQISDLGSLSAMTLDGSGTFNKVGSGADVLTAIIPGLTGDLSISIS